MKEISYETIVKTLVESHQLEWGVGLCHYTGELVNKGFYLQPYDLYFSTEELLLKYIREIDNDTNTDGEPLTDDFLLQDWYDSDCSGEGYYYSEWADDLDNINYIKLNNNTYKIKN